MALSSMMLARLRTPRDEECSIGKDKKNNFKLHPPFLLTHILSCVLLFVSAFL